MYTFTYTYLIFHKTSVYLKQLTTFIFFRKSEFWHAWVLSLSLDVLYRQKQNDVLSMQFIVSPKWLDTESWEITYFHPQNSQNILTALVYLVATLERVYNLCLNTPHGETHLRKFHSIKRYLILIYFLDTSGRPHHEKSKLLMALVRRPLLYIALLTKTKRWKWHYKVNLITIWYCLCWKT